MCAILLTMQAICILSLVLERPEKTSPGGVLTCFSHRTMNAPLQLLQQSKANSSPPPPSHIPYIDPLEQQKQSIQPINPSSPQQANNPTPLQQRTPEPLADSILANPLISDTLRMFTPVGQSPNDEQLLVMALQSGLSQGLDHKRAIERLHGVSPRPYALRFLPSQSGE